MFPVAAGSPPPTHPLSPLMLSVYVFAPKTIVEPAFAGLFANWTAPRRLQSFATAGLQTDAAVSAAPAGSSVRSTVSVEAAIVTTVGDTASSPTTTMPRSPIAVCGIGRTAVGASTAALSAFTAAATLRVGFREAPVEAVAATRSNPPAAFATSRSSVSSREIFPLVSTFCGNVPPEPRAIGWPTSQPDDVDERQAGFDFASRGLTRDPFTRAAARRWIVLAVAGRVSRSFGMSRRTVPSENAAAISLRPSRSRMK